MKEINFKLHVLYGKNISVEIMYVSRDITCHLALNHFLRGITKKACCYTVPACILVGVV